MHFLQLKEKRKKRTVMNRTKRHHDNQALRNAVRQALAREFKFDSSLNKTLMSSMLLMYLNEVCRV